MQHETGLDCFSKAHLQTHDTFALPQLGLICVHTDESRDASSVNQAGSDNPSSLITAAACSSPPPPLAPLSAVFSPAEIPRYPPRNYFANHLTLLTR